jgi:hypothetical protein
MMKAGHRWLPGLCALAAIGAALWMWRREPQVGRAEVHPNAGISLERRSVPLPHLTDADQPVLVRVLDPDGRPAAGAEIFLENPDAPADLVRAFDDAHPIHTLAARLQSLGTRHVADAYGALRAPLPRLRLFGIAAHADDRWVGATHLREDFGPESTLTLRLAPALELAVLVLGSDDAPRAGIPIGYRSDAGNLGRALALTGADGIARMRALPEVPPLPPGSAFPAVGFGFPCDASGLRRLESTDFGITPVTMRLPPLGEVTAEIVDASGRPAADGTLVVMQEAVPRALSDRWTTPSESLQSARGVVRDGTAHFPFVGLGHGLEIAADFQSTGRFEGVTFPGPLEAGERVRVILQQRHVLPALRGRVHSDSAAPLADLALTAHLIYVDEYGIARDEKAGMRTDAAGRFHRAFADAESLAQVRQYMLLLASRQSGILHVAVGEREGSLGNEPLDFGDLLLGGPLLVCGETISPERGKVRNVYGTLRSKDRTLSPTWQHALMRLQWLGDGDSRFEIRGPFPPGVYVLHAAVDDAPPAWSATSVEFEAGDRDCVVRFETEWMLEGQVLLDDHVPSDALTFSLREGERVLSGRVLDYLVGRASLRLPLTSSFEKVELTIFGGSDGWPLWELTDDERDRDGSLDFGWVDLRGELGIARLALPSARRALLFPEGSRARAGYVEVRHNDVIVFRLDAPHCDVALPRRPLTELVLHDGVVALPK